MRGLGVRRRARDAVCALKNHARGRQRSPAIGRRQPGAMTPGTPRKGAVRLLGLIRARQGPVLEREAAKAVPTVRRRAVRRLARSRPHRPAAAGRTP